jgi:hypothetical protein
MEDPFFLQAYEGRQRGLGNSGGEGGGIDRSFCSENSVLVCGYLNPV